MFGLFFLVISNMTTVKEHFYKGPQGILTNISQLIWSFILYLRGRQKQTFQKIAVFTMKETSGPFFPGIIEFDKPQWTIYMSPQAILTVNVEPKRAFL